MCLSLMGQNRAPNRLANKFKSIDDQNRSQENLKATIQFAMKFGEVSLRQLFIPAAEASV